MNNIAIIDDYPGTDDEKFRAAFDDVGAGLKSEVQLSARTYLTTDTISPKGSFDFYGRGEQSEIVCQDKTKTIIKPWKLSNYRLRDFAITHNAEEGEYHPGGYDGPGVGAFGILPNTGGGFDYEPTNVTIERVYCHHIISAGIVCYGGGTKHYYNDNRIEYTGRGALCQQGVIYGQMKGNKIFMCGDDGIASHGNSVGTVISGNTIVGSGFLGLHTAGIKVTGNGVTIEGNHISDCCDGIATNSIPSGASASPSTNGLGYCQGLIITGNTITGMRNLSGVGLKLQRLLSGTVSDNYVHAFTPTGDPCVTVRVTLCQNVRSNGNQYYGGGHQFKGGFGDIQFTGDDVYDFRHPTKAFAVLDQPCRGHRLAYKECVFLDHNEVFYEGNKYTTTEQLVFQGNRTAKYVPIAYPAVELRDTFSEMPLAYYARQNPIYPLLCYDGPVCKVYHGQNLYLCDRRLKRVELQAKSNIGVGSHDLQVDEATVSGTFKLDESWLSLRHSGNPKQLTRLKNGAIVHEVVDINNELGL